MARRGLVIGWRALALVLVVVTSGPWGLARAQDDTYRRLAEDAARAVSERRLPEALSLFREMHAIAPSARTLWSLGRVHYELSEYVTALEYLEQALLDERRPLEEAQREEVRALEARARALIGEVALEITPADATVLLDDAVVTGSTLRLDPGDHTLRFERPGFEAAVRRVAIRGGERSSMSVTLSTRAETSMVDVLGALVPPPPSEVRLAVRALAPPGESLTLHLGPLAISGPADHAGEHERVCEAPCEVTRLAGLYAASVSRGDDEPLPVAGPIPLTADAMLTLVAHDETVFRTVGWVIVGVLLAYGVVGSAIGIADLAMGPDTALHDALGTTGAGVLLGTGISAAVLALPFLSFALAPDWAEIGVLPLAAADPRAPEARESQSDSR